jgi:heme/copper-type cytochrome/quinol oxidase subunit 2
MGFQAELRWFLMVVCLAIFGLVFAVMLVSAWIQHRKGDKEIANFHGSVAVEVCWALAPLVIVMQLVWPTVRSVLTP